MQTIIQLPALPTIAMEVVEMVDNPKTSASKLGRLISTDQALTAKVLKIANSPFYGFPRKISTIDFAIIVLGYDALKEIVISISLVSSLQKKSDRMFDAKVFWDHCDHQRRPCPPPGARPGVPGERRGLRGRTPARYGDLGPPPLFQERIQADRRNSCGTPT